MVWFGTVRYGMAWYGMVRKYGEGEIAHPSSLLRQAWSLEGDRLVLFGRPGCGQIHASIRVQEGRSILATVSHPASEVHLLTQRALAPPHPPPPRPQIPFHLTTTSEL